MAKENFGSVQTFKAAADYSDYQYCPVYMSAADTITITGAGGIVDGILLNKPNAAGRPAEVLTASGCFCKLKVATGVSIDDVLEADASSRGVTVAITAPGTTVSYSIGRANEASTEANQLITVLTNFVPISTGT